MTLLNRSEFAAPVACAGPAGLAPEALDQQQPGISRSTLNRRLAELVKAGVIRALGAGRATRYVPVSPFTRADIDVYFEQHWQQRPLATFNP